MAEHLVLCGGVARSFEILPLSTRTLAAFLRPRVEPLDHRVSVLDAYPGQEVDELVDRLRELEPTMLGLSCYTWSVEQMFDLCTAAKRAMPDVLTILGGPEVNLDRGDMEQLLATVRGADIVVRGEGELALLNLMSMERNARPASGTVLEGSILGDLGDLGAPVLAVSPPAQPSALVAVEFGRGCRHHCAYCAMNQTPRRNRPSGDLVREFAWIREHKPALCLHVDAYINPSEEATLERIRLIHQEGIAQDPLHFLCIDYLTISEEEVRAVASLRALVSVGVQSIQPAALKTAHRGFRLDRLERIFDWSEKYGLNILVDLIYGLPNDTLEGLYDSADYLRRAGVPFRCLGLQVIPGTDFYHRRHELGLKLEHGSRLVLETPTMTAREFQEARTFATETVREQGGWELREYVAKLLGHPFPGDEAPEGEVLGDGTRSARSAELAPGAEGPTEVRHSRSEDPTGGGRDTSSPIEAAAADSGFEAVVEPFEIEKLASRDELRDYTMRPYSTAEAPDEPLESVNLLYALLGASDERGRWRQLITSLRATVGRNRTVWGAKLSQGQLSFELYFYLRALSANPTGHAEPHEVVPRPVPVAKFWDGLAPVLQRPKAAVWKTPAVMFSVDVDDAALACGSPGGVHVYLNSGLSFDLVGDRFEHANYYRFFELQSVDRLRELLAYLHNGLFHASTVGDEIQEVLVPELYACRTICLAAKRSGDGVYFSGLRGPQLEWFLEAHQWPTGVRHFMAAHRDALSPLRWDVGLDFRQGDGGRLQWTKTGLYGTF